MKPARRHRFGESHPQARLSSKDVIEIRKRYDAGLITYRELAEQYGVGCSTISNILNLKTWRRVKND